MNYLIAKGLLKELDKMEFQDIPKNSVVLTNISYTVMLFWPQYWASAHHSFQNKIMEAQPDEVEYQDWWIKLHHSLRSNLHSIAISLSKF